MYPSTKVSDHVYVYCGHRFFCFYDFSNGFGNCSDSVVFFFTLSNDSVHINVNITLNTGTFSYIFTLIPIQ